MLIFFPFFFICSVTERLIWQPNCVLPLQICHLEVFAQWRTISSRSIPICYCHVRSSNKIWLKLYALQGRNTKNSVLDFQVKFQHIKKLEVIAFILNKEIITTATIGKKKKGPMKELKMQSKQWYWNLGRKMNSKNHNTGLFTWSRTF